MKILNIGFDVAGLKDMQQMEQAGKQVQAALDGGAEASQELLAALQRARKSLTRMRVNMLILRR